MFVHLRPSNTAAHLCEIARYSEVLCSLSTKKSDSGLRHGLGPTTSRVRIPRAPPGRAVEANAGKNSWRRLVAPGGLRKRQRTHSLGQKKTLQPGANRNPNAINAGSPTRLREVPQARVGPSAGLLRVLEARCAGNRGSLQIAAGRAENVRGSRLFGKRPAGLCAKVFAHGQ